MVHRILPIAAAAALACAAVSPLVGAEEPALAVRITSPLGRTGLPGAIRIVAQVQQREANPARHVRFFVDEQLLRVVEQAPFVVEWIDSNPFERSEIAVEAVDAAGNIARDRVILQPFEVNESAEVSSVLLEAVVQDKGGRFVKDLPPSMFSLLEDGVPQGLDLVMQESVGATFALLVDSSASMARRMDFVQRTATTLAGYMSERDRMLVAPFSKSIIATTGPTDDARTITDAIGAIRPAGGTAILDALSHVAKSLEGVEGRRVIVLITDGYDEHSVTSFDEALAAVKAARATVYVVGIGGVAGISLRGERLLKQLSTDTGGRAFFPATEPQLATVHDTLTEDVHNRYLLTYTPANQTLDGQWREITVRTAEPNHRVRTRAGYFAPKPPPIRPNIEFTASDTSGRYLDLTIDDLEVREDGEVQQVEAFQEAVQPVSIILALDASGSMRRKEAEVIESARRFVEALRPEDKLALVLFADSVEFAHELSTDRDLTYRAIANYRASGGTALYDAVSESLLRLKQSGDGRHVMVVMTDGRDENNPGTAPGSLRTLAEVLQQQHQTRATVFGIGLGTTVDQAPLRSLAEVSGGKALFPERVEDLGREYERVIEDLRRRYMVSYTSTRAARDGSWREVRIRVKNQPDAAVRTTGGYFAPGQ